MALSNQERVAKAMDLLRAGLAPFVEREFTSPYQAKADDEARRYFRRRPHRGQEADRRVGRGGAPEADVGGMERRLRQDARPCRLRADLRRTGDFARIHPLPRSGADEPDDLDTRLVVLPPEHPYTKEPGSAAETAGRAILEIEARLPGGTPIRSFAPRRRTAGR